MTPDFCFWKGEEIQLRKKWRKHKLLQGLAEGLQEVTQPRLLLTLSGIPQFSYEAKTLRLSGPCAWQKETHLGFWHITGEVSWVAIKL